MAYQFDWHFLHHSPDYSYLLSVVRELPKEVRSDHDSAIMRNTRINKCRQF